MRVFLAAAVALVLFNAPRSSAFSERKFAEILPLKAAMLTKQWQGLLLDVDQKVGIVPELGKTSVGVQRFGDELERRTKCARQFEEFYQSTFALALADKEKLPKMAMAKRKLVSNLQIDGKARGPGCVVVASLTVPATLSIVEQLDDQWSVLALTVNPTERNIEKIVKAEVAMLNELCVRAKAANVPIRLLASVTETLAGDFEQLNLIPPDESEGDEEMIWLQCKA